jgi:hypothetical protein
MPQEHLPDPKETISRFEKLLAGLIRGGVDLAVCDQNCRALRPPSPLNGERD